MERTELLNKVLDRKPFQIHNVHMTLKEVSELTGATPRQLQWWDEQGHFPAEFVKGSGGGGMVRTYDPSDVRAVNTLLLLQERFGNQAVSRLARPIREGSKRNAKFVVSNGYMASFHKTQAAAWRAVLQADSPVSCFQIPDAVPEGRIAA